MTSQPDLRAVRTSSLATLDEIRSTERSLKAKGIDVDDGEWMQLRDIVARIERRLAANVTARPSEEAAE